MDFQDFVGGLSAFSSKGGREEKLRCKRIFQCSPGLAYSLGNFHVVAFKVYDMDRDGYISNGELYLVLKQMVGNNLKVSTSFDKTRIRSVTFDLGSATATNCRQDDHGGRQGWVSPRQTIASLIA